MIAAAVFDFCDGMAARALKAYSAIGKEIDSLADMVSFGVAPAIIVTSFTGCGLTGNEVLVFLPLLIAPFSALRLAKFNLDERQKENFIGLATPANALFLASLVCTSVFYPSILHFWHEVPWLIAIISLVMCYLIVSEIPMFSLKFKDFEWKSNRMRFIFLALAAAECLAVLVLGLKWSTCIFFIIASYIVMNLLLLFKRDI